MAKVCASEFHIFHQNVLLEKKFSNEISLCHSVSKPFKYDLHQEIFKLIFTTFSSPAPSCGGPISSDGVIF